MSRRLWSVFFFVSSKQVVVYVPSVLFRKVLFSEESYAVGQGKFIGFVYIV